MPNHDTHTIDKYLTGRMKGETLISFEQQLLDDTDLQAAVDERKDLLTVVDALGDIQMKERAKRIHEIAMQPTAKVHRLAVWRFAVAAVVAIAISFGIWLWLQPASPTELYTQYYEPYPSSFSSRDGNADQQLSQASELYDNGNFSNAIPILDELLAKDVKNKDGIRLAAGISQMEMGDGAAAMSHFKNLIDNPSSPYHEQGIWYAALFSLRNEDIPSAKKYLRQLISEEGSYFYDKAVNLLGELE